MRLTHIKLAGFKSFVDPTTIPVPGQLVAVCGPNGCGKSNVIDAVRWVLGESSAKQLRGESMQDVIFNGSTTRKAVSRSSVELLFDNQAGLAAGAWSAYAEISIKRVLTRQGESSYFINHQAVRRRDITDLFLGTGVGKSGYAIIEQGMISRIIEAKPEELRHFLEEAAGVSKYKERRRETEHRIADTRDNLLRVADVQLELQNQIDRLSRQASVAQQYQALQNQITEKQQLLALQRKLDAAQIAQQAHMALLVAQTALDAALALLRDKEAQLEALRETHFSASDTLHAAQAELYAANAEVARMEQTILHLRQNRERIALQIQQNEQESEQLANNLQQINSDLLLCAEQEDDLNLAQEEAMLKREASHLSLPEHEQALLQADLAWQTLREQVNELQSAQKLMQQQMQFALRNQQSLLLRQKQLNLELERIASSLANTEDDLPEKIANLQFELAEQELQLAQNSADQTSGEQALQLAKSQAQTAHMTVMQLAARETALLEVLPQTNANGVLQDWLLAHQLQGAEKILDSLQVSAGWELAVEAILGQKLNGIVAEITADAPPSALFILQSDPGLLAPVIKAGSLLEKISASPSSLLQALHITLADVYCVESVTQLLQQRVSLAEGMSLVSKDGHIATRYTLDFFAGQTQSAVSLTRYTELRAIQAQLPNSRSHNAQVQAQLQQLEAMQLQLQQAVQGGQNEKQQIQHQLQQLEHQYLREQERTENLTARHAELSTELQHNQQQYTVESDLLTQLTQQSEALEQQSWELQQAEQQTRFERDGLQQTQSLQGQLLREVEREAQAAAFAVQSMAQKIRALQQRKQETQALATQQAERLAALIQERETLVEPDFDVQFQAALAVQAEKERVLASARDALNQFANTLRELEAHKQSAEQSLEVLRDALNQARLVEQEARLGFERFAAEWEELAIDEAALLPLLERSAKAIQAEIARLTQQLASLGAVNLAAVQELNESEERQNYLAAQAQDLEQAMATLAAAIARIDKETRNLLQATYDAVNCNLQELFPALFGGGHAELVLTGDEILDAGMSIMAQPPGKKNATIHLLSGGEKALTALSLVFSLFKLNPAPFCLLDEVDAPLDDANTLRFCELVKKMAQYTQFLYISHNKLTMEMAQQLVGVTMQEQGVSRIVAVDIEQALKMREPELI